MVDEPFFTNGDDAEELETRRKNRIKELRGEMKKRHGANYNPVFHDKIIEEIARSEIVVDRYDFMLQNDLEPDFQSTIYALKNERAQLNKNRSLLQLDVKAVRVAKEKKVEGGQDMPDSVKDSLFKALQQAQEDGEIKSDDEDDEEEGDGW